MQVIIRQVVGSTDTIEKDIKVTSLILEQDPQRPHDITLFYCFKCRNAVFKYNGFLSWVVPGDVPAVLPSYHECKQCKSQYMLVKVI